MPHSPGQMIPQAFSVVLCEALPAVLPSAQIQTPFATQCLESFPALQLMQPVEFPLLHYAVLLVTHLFLCCRHFPESVVSLAPDCTCFQPVTRFTWHNIPRLSEDKR